MEPTEPVEDDPNVTDERFPGNPTGSYRSCAPVRVAGELVDRTGHPPERLPAMRASLERLRREGTAVVLD